MDAVLFCSFDLSARSLEPSCGLRWVGETDLMPQVGVFFRCANCASLYKNLKSVLTFGADLFALLIS